MEFNQPAEDNIFDRATIIGKPHHRIDGPLKVSGRAPYAYERHDVVEGQLRRSQRHRLSWERFQRLLRKYLPPCRLMHPHPDARLTVTTSDRSRMR
ncbi:hypothetical protein [Sinorhizobium meliloti]|uniref:hypothetical protein n=1 Tax=Rhizobium meliloti TaxID=382 RepID=UPI00308060FE